MWETRARFPPSGEDVGPCLRHFSTTPSKATATPSDSWRDRRGEFRDPECGLEGCDDRRGVQNAWRGTLVPRLLAVPPCIGYTRARRPHSHAPRPQYPPDTCFTSRGAGRSAYRGPLRRSPAACTSVPLQQHVQGNPCIICESSPRNRESEREKRTRFLSWCTFRPLCGSTLGGTYTWESGFEPS